MRTSCPLLGQNERVCVRLVGGVWGACLSVNERREVNTRWGKQSVDDRMQAPLRQFFLGVERKSE
jgi:hypothetical protein